MTSAAAYYNVSLTPSSPFFFYDPSRDGPTIDTWNASYTGSSVWPQLDDESPLVPSGRQYRRTHAGRAAVGIKFRGVAFALCYSPGGAVYSGSYGVGNENGPPLTARGLLAREYCGEEAVEVAYATNLRDEEHTFIIALSGQTDEDFEFYGGIITIPIAGEKGNTVVETEMVDDQAKGWTFTETDPYQWDRSAGGRTLYNATQTMSCGHLPITRMTRTFTGAGGIVLYGNVWPDAHYLTVIFNDESPWYWMDATSSWEDGQSVFYARGGLDLNDTHNITIINDSTYQWNCTTRDLRPGQEVRKCCVGIDALMLLRAVDPATVTSSSLPGPSGTSKDPLAFSRLNVAAIAGGTVGGVVTLVLLALLAFCLLRRRNRSAAARDLKQTSLLSGAYSTDTSMPSWDPSSLVPIAAPAGTRQEKYLAAPEPQSPTSGTIPSLSFTGVGVATEAPSSGLSSPPSHSMSSPTVSGDSPARPPRLLPPLPGSGSPTNIVSAPQVSGAAAGTAVRMTEEDMARILNFVAARMDAPVTGSQLPQYPGVAPPPPPPS